MELTNFKFDYADKSAIKYLKSLNLCTFDGKRIPFIEDIRLKVFNALSLNAYFFPICLYKFSEMKLAEDRQEFLKQRFNSKEIVHEYLVICGEKRLYVFTKEYYFPEGKGIYILEIIQSGFTEKETPMIISIINSAFHKQDGWHPECDVFYSGSQITDLEYNIELKLKEKYNFDYEIEQIAEVIRLKTDCKTSQMTFQEIADITKIAVEDVNRILSATTFIWIH